MECVCGSANIVEISGHCCDSFYLKAPGHETYDGYVPDNMGIGGGDEIEFSYCLNCGRIQDKFPIPENAFEDFLADCMDDDYDDEEDEDDL